MEQLTAEEVIALYRVRWQIELLFKLWKEHGKLDEVRSQQPWRVSCEVLAKLVGVVIEHWMLVLASWPSSNRSLRKVVSGIQSYAVALALAVSSVGAMVEVLHHLCRTLQVGSQLNPRTRSSATYQLLANATLALPAHLIG